MAHSTFVKALGHLFNNIKQGFKRIGHGIQRGAQWFGRRIVKPVALSGLNLSGYIFDKMLLGSPVIRPQLKGGLWSSDLSEKWRDFVENNEGLNVYKAQYPIIDNLFGILGLGIGFVNILNHFMTSWVKNIRSTYNLLGKHGVLSRKTLNNPKGDRLPLDDSRKLFLKIIFGILSFPLVLGLAILTNTIDAFLTCIKHIGLSIGHNSIRTFDLLKGHGIYDEVRIPDDNRHSAVKIIFGILSFPIVALTSITSNLVNLICMGLWHAGISLINNTTPFTHILGKYGSFGNSHKFKDKRTSFTLKIVFGLLTFPLSALIVILTNTIDTVVTVLDYLIKSIYDNVKKFHNLFAFAEKQQLKNSNTESDDDNQQTKRRLFVFKIIFHIITLPIVLSIILISNTIIAIGKTLNHIGLSIKSNLRNTYNLLDKQGMYGERNFTPDPRKSLIQKLIFGFLSAPVVMPLSLVANLVNVVLSIFKHAALSIARNTQATWHLLGKHGMFKKSAPFHDKDRPLALKIIFGFLTGPITLSIIILTNSLDLLLTGCKHWGISFVTLIIDFHDINTLNKKQNVSKQEDFPEEEEAQKNDIKKERHPLVRFIFTLLALPVALPILFITNFTIGIGKITKNFGISFKYNFLKTYNLLGDDGIFPKQNPVKVKRSRATDILFDILTFPFVLSASLIANVIDFILSGIKNFALSVIRNLRCSYNVLGQHGLLGHKTEDNPKGRRLKYQDDRGLFTVILFGVLSAPITIALAIAANMVDILLTSFYHTALSIQYNIKANYNILGRSGVLGGRKRFDDNARKMIVKIIFGLISLPIVLPLLLITNSLDFLLSSIQNLAQSFVENIRRFHNLYEFNKYNPPDEMPVFDDLPLTPKIDLPKKRHPIAVIVFGLFTFPFVFPIVLLTNTVITLKKAAQEWGISCWINFLRTHNLLLGKLGIYGARQKYADARPLPLKIIFGLLSAPFVAALAIVSNLIDAVGAYFKNWRKTIKIPAEYGIGIGIFLITALPAFVIRKTVKAFYNILIGPFVDLSKGRSFHGGRFLRGLANLATAGIFSILTKIVKAVSGYSHRFGSAKNKKLDAGDLEFKKIVQLTESGEFKNKEGSYLDDMGKIRPILRLIYGWRHKTEKISKTMHDSYRDYRREEHSKKKENLIKPSIAGFFDSKKYKTLENKIKKSLDENEQSYLQDIKSSLWESNL